MRGTTRRYQASVKHGETHGVANSISCIAGEHRSRGDALRAFINIFLSVLTPRLAARRRS